MIYGGVGRVNVPLPLTAGRCVGMCMLSILLAWYRAT